MPGLKALSILMLAVLLQGAPAAQSDEVENLEALDEVLVVGRQPGPPLWKISSGENVLWILPLVDYYPSKMEWKSARVERLIAESQESISQPVNSSTLSIASIKLLSFSRTLGLYNDLMYLPNGRTLKQVLPPELYERYRAIRSRYFPRHSRAATMSLTAVQSLMREEILKREGLARPSVVTDKTSAWRRANTIMRRTRVGESNSYSATTADLKALRKLVGEARKSDTVHALQVVCFDKVMAYYENDLEAAKRRAIAWAQGHADNLVSAARPYPEECREPWKSMQGSPAARNFYEKSPEWAAILFADHVATRAKSRDKWLAAAELALSRNVSTYAELMVNDMLGPDGLVTRLQEKGYKVDVSAEQDAK